MSKAGYVIKSVTTKKAVVAVGDAEHTFDLSNEAVAINLLGRGIKRYMDAAKAGKDAGTETTKALEKAASDMAAGRMGRASFDAKSFLKTIEDCKTLDDLSALNKQVANAPKKDQAEIATLISNKTLEIALNPKK